MALTFEGSPDGQVSQGQGMTDQERPQGKNLVQFTQCHCQTRLAGQTTITELQPMVHLQLPESIVNEDQWIKVYESRVGVTVSVRPRVQQVASVHPIYTRTF